jgi:hypothetical protein
VAVYPGTFNPPTVAHLAIAEAARDQAGLDVVELVVSTVALGKESLRRPLAEERLEVLAAVAATRPWLAARGTRHRLVADIADGAAAVVLGADKWAQVLDPAWYDGDEAARDRAVARLPLVLVAPRPPHPLPARRPGVVEPLDVAPEHHPVSSTSVRAGRHEWMLPEAARSGLWAAGG